MLLSTFQHIKGIGQKKEHDLWSQGVTTWQSYMNMRGGVQLSLLNGLELQTDDPLLETMMAYKRGDIDFFAEALPASEHYRIALSYPEDTLFLDIETTGLSLYYDQLTMVGWSIGDKYGVYIAGQNEACFAEALAYAKVVITFNGTMFDLKFLRKTFPGIRIPSAHVDLRYLAKRVGLKGGQKAIEDQIGFVRPEIVNEMHGESAPILWHQYRRGDNDALRKLIIYNHCDVEGMKHIFDHSIHKLSDSHGMPQDILPKVKYSELKSQIHWVSEKPLLHNPYQIFVDDYSGSNDPLISYDDLNEIGHLDSKTVIGIDLVSSEMRETGYCILKGNRAVTCRVKTDEEMIRMALEAGADLVSIDSPLSIPEGRTSFFDDDPMREFGIMRECERILKKRGVNVYPCLIPSMQKLTQRGMLLAEKFKQKGIEVIESYPGAAQDIMSIPRKQAGLEHLTQGLGEFGIKGVFLDEEVSHDELDAITSAIVGHFYLAGMYEALGNNAEDVLIIPDLNGNRKNGS